MQPSSLIASLPLNAADSDTLVVLATYNEVDSIADLLDGLLALKTRCDVLIVDDGSTDGTLDVIAARAADEHRVGLVLRPHKLGVGSAHKLGWLHARSMGYSRIATLDADLSHDPADVQRLFHALDAGADVALGSRFVAGGRLDYRGVRLFISRTANAQSRLLLGLPIAEYTTSLRAAKLARVPPGLVETIESDGYAFFLTCIVRMARAGLTIIELPIHFRDRQHGESKISKREILFGAANLLKHAVFRRTFRESGSQDTHILCMVCGRPYCLQNPSGTIRCLACSATFGASR